MASSRKAIVAAKRFIAFVLAVCIMLFGGVYLHIDQNPNLDYWHTVNSVIVAIGKGILWLLGIAAIIILFVWLIVEPEEKKSNNR